MVIGSRDAEKAGTVVGELKQRWRNPDIPLVPGSNSEAAQADLVVLATPWEGAVTTAKQLAPELSGKIVVSMVNAMTRWGDHFVPLLPPTGSIAVAVANALPASRVAGAFHHIPAGPFGNPDHMLGCDVMVFCDDRSATSEVIELVNRIPGLRGLDVGGLGSALAVEALTAALVEVKFDGIVILDHTPEVIGGHYPEQAYGFAYMKALKNRAIAESKA